MREVLVDHPQVVWAETPGPGHPSVDLQAQLHAVGVQQRAALHAGLAGEVGEVVVHGGQTGGGSGDLGVVVVGQGRHVKALQQEEADVEFDEAAGLPVEGQAVHDAQASGPRQPFSGRK